MGVCVSRASAVIVHRVPPGEVDWFLEWQRGTTTAAEQFQGFLGGELFPPTEGHGDEWVALIHFADAPSLNSWLESPVRTTRIETLRARLGDFTVKPLTGGFGAWFAGLSPGSDSAPPSWKVAITVLLGLYPTVMLLTIFVGPYTAPLGLAASMLIGNALSVAILQWGVMPRLTARLHPWLQAHDRRCFRSQLGELVLILLVLGGILFGFQRLTG